MTVQEADAIAQALEVAEETLADELRGRELLLLLDNFEQLLEAAAPVGELLQAADGEEAGDLRRRLDDLRGWRATEAAARTQLAGLDADVLAQRLIRKICENCKTAYEPSEKVLASLGLSIHDIGDKNFYYGKGCEVCNQTGYKGRKGIYELLKISDPIREMINDRAPGVLVRQKAIELGMTTLREDGLRSIYDGLTTIEEVVKYT
jgi:hypothetical protein